MNPKNILIGIGLTTSVVLTSCSSSQGSGDFGCKATAFDSCLSIEEVDAMTSFADSPYIRRKANQKPKINTKRSYHTSNQDKAVWLSPSLNNNLRG